MHNLIPVSFATPQLTLAGLQMGSGEPIIGLHGWLDNAATFALLGPQLNGQLTALDLRGHGHSEHVNGPYNIWDSLIDVLAVIEQIDEPVHLLGHSMGAGIATLFAGCFPDRVRSLNLIEGFGPWIEPELSPRDELRRAARAAQKPRGRPRPFASIDQAAQIRSSKGVTPVTAQAIRPVVERALARSEAGYVWRSDPWLRVPSALKMTESQVQSCLDSIRCPVKIALGNQGMLNQSSMFQGRLSQVPQARVKTFVGDHHLHLYPEAVESIGQWFNEGLA